MVKRFAHISEQTVSNPNFTSIIQTLTNLRHPNLITCYSLNSKSVQLTTEKPFPGPDAFQHWDMTIERVQGSMETVLKNSRATGIPSFSFSSIATIYTSIVDCFVYLHEVVHIMHGNLKFSNILISESKTFPLLDAPGQPSKFTVKVGDLVSHKVANFEEIDPRLQGVAGWMNYMAPEITRGVREGFAFDVYCFGNILWQLLSFDRDFIETFKDSQVGSSLVPLGRPEILFEKQRKELDRLRLDLALELDKLRLVPVIEACWSYTPGLRPTFAGLAQWGIENLIPLPTPQVPTALQS
jgi:serine/threonine protein kinase